MTETLTPYELAAAELRIQKLDPLQIESILRRRAYGHLCAGLASLFTASSFYAELNSPVGRSITKAAKKLAELAPDYSTIEQTLGLTLGNEVREDSTCSQSSAT